MSFTTYNEWAEDALAPHACALLRGMEHPLKDETYLALEPVLSREAILHAIRTFPVELLVGAESFSFMRDFHVNSKLAKVFTPRQLRAAANVLRFVLRGGVPGEAVEPIPTPKGPVTVSVTPSWDRTKKVYKCYDCGEEITGIDSLYTHRENVHGKGRGARGIAATTPASAAPTVLSTFKPTLDLDLRVLPDGRYALKPNPALGLAEPWFVIKRTVRNQYHRRGRFIWGRAARGYGEYIERGRIEVRVQVGDTKELIGEQKASEAVYYGEHEDKLKVILEEPTSAMVLYGQLIGACAYCGRSLTDELSRLRGIGPDCWDGKHMPHLMAWTAARAAARAGGTP